jgi:hypothetical protein
MASLEPTFGREELHPRSSPTLDLRFEGWRGVEHRLVKRSEVDHLFPNGHSFFEMTSRHSVSALVFHSLACHMRDDELGPVFALESPQPNS